MAKNPPILLTTPAFIPAPATAKIIEFPRSWTPPLPALDELAEPVVDRPRILEAPGSCSSAAGPGWNHD